MSRLARAVLLGATVSSLTGCGPSATPAEGRTDAASAAPWFVDEAAIRGLAHEHVSGYPGGAALPYLPEIVAGGAALFDADGDHDLDIYLVQAGGRLGETEPAAGNRLFTNRGDGTFVPADAADGEDTGYGMGVAIGDYDADGDVDLYVTNVGPNVLLRNRGDGRFDEVGASAGVDDPGWGTSAAFVDFDLDGDLDLFVVNYMHWSITIERDCRVRGRPTYCAPTTYRASAPDKLFENLGDGSFRDVSLAAGLTAAYGNGLGLVTADFDDDGLTDLFVANDKTVNQLWLNRGDLTFEEAASRWGVAVDDQGAAKAGMGVGAADVDRDGDVDLLVVNLEGETDSFFLNEGSYMVDATARSGLGPTSRRSTRFGIALADFDNDGRDDLFEANGKVIGDATATPDAFAESNVLFRGAATNPPRFEVVPGGVSDMPATSRAVAAGDVDGDGRIDLVVVNRDASVALLMNRTAGAASVRFRALDAGGRDVVGARVVVDANDERMVREIRTAASFLAANEPVAHFGLGGRRVPASVAVLWPGTTVPERFGEYPPTGLHVLRQGDGIRAR